MASKLGIFVCFLFVASVVCHHHEGHLVNVLKTHEIIPDLIDSAPHVQGLNVTYGNNTAVHYGDELVPTLTRALPTNVSWNADPTSLYTVLFVDPDAPSREDPRFRSWQHWVVVNIPGNNTAKGTTLTQYAGPSPPANTGLHRYVFLVFKQENELSVDEPIISSRAGSRGKFSVREFAAKHHLGTPKAVNFFQAQHETPVEQPENDSM